MKTPPLATPPAPARRGIVFSIILRLRRLAFLCLAPLCLALAAPSGPAAAVADPPAERPAPEAGDAGDFRVLDIGERTYAGGSALAVVLSEPLDPAASHDAHLRVSDEKEMLKSAWVLSEDGRSLYFPHVAPETKYSVTVLPTLTSAAGRALAERKSQSVETRKVEPIVSFASRGLILPSRLTDGLPVVTVNIPAVDIDFFRLGEKALTHYIEWENTTGQKGYYQLDNVKEYGELVFTGRFDLDAPPNRRVTRHIPVENIPALTRPGIYLAVMRQPGEYSYEYQATHFVVTDIGLHARIYNHQAEIIASSIKTGAPLPGVQLQFIDAKGNQVSRGETDAMGRFSHAGGLAGNVQIIVARMGEEMAALPLDPPALDLSEFDLEGRPQRPREAFVYGPRDLYRPGESVTVAALLRDHDGRTGDSLPLKAHLLRPDGRRVRAFTWHPADPGGMGYYETEIQLPEAAQTGLWKLQLFDDPGAKAPMTEYAFHVEEFLPERIKLDLDAAPAHPGMDETLLVTADAAYLYGAPASGNRLTAKVIVRARREMLEKIGPFQIGMVEDKDYKDFFELEEMRLDEAGKHPFEVESRWADVKSPLDVYVVASVYESGGRPVTRNVRRAVWPAPTLVGVRPLFEGEYADVGPVSFEVVRVDSDERMLAADSLEVTLTREDRDYYWEYSESNGWQYRYNEKIYPYLNDTLSLSAGAPTRYTAHLSQGQYVLSIRNPESGQATSVRFQVGRYWWHGDGDAAARPDKATLTLDRAAYRPGDVIGLTITPPHDGLAVVMVEGNRPLWIDRMPVSASGTKVEIPVSAAWDSHDLYISALVLRPADAEEKIAPNRAMGLIHLPLDRSDRRIPLSIEAPEKITPLGPVTVTIAAGETLPPEAWVTVAAVDVGILNITDFKTPDPFAWFFARRRYAVEARDIYGKIIEELWGPQTRLRFGGDADLAGGKKPDTKVRLVSLFHGPVAFDANRKAEVTFQIPDFNGRLRIMALAFSETAYGSGEREMTVAAPIVTQLSMPRFLSPRDRTQLTLDVHNLSGKDRSIDLRMTATEPLVLSEGERRLPLADGEKRTLSFPVTALPAHAPSVIALHLTSDEITLDRDWQLGVRPGYPALAKKERAILNNGDAFPLDDRMVADLIPETVVADVKLTSVIPIDMRQALRGLLQFPYGCLEQITSRAWPLLFATPEAIARFHLDPLKPEERMRRITLVMDRLPAMQLSNGGFSLWDRSGPESTWLTVYVTDFMLTARDRGVDVPESVLEEALGRLTVYLKKGAPMEGYMDNTDRESVEFATRCYAGAVLARLGRVQLGALRNLYDNHRKKAHSPLPLAHLGTALADMGDRKRAGEALALAAKKRRDADGCCWGDYGSPLRDLALTLPLLMTAKNPPAGVDKMMMDMEDQMRRRQWLSTQERNAVFRLGLLLEDRADRQWTATSYIGETATPLDQRGAYLFSPDLADFDRGIRLVSSSEGMLFASAVVNGYPKNPPPANDTHMAIERTLLDLSGKPIEGRTFNVGDLILVHLRILSRQRVPDGLVVDLLPAGFEIENQNLKHAVKIADFQVENRSVWEVREATRIVHEEFRDDRYVAAAVLEENQPTHLFYMVRAVTPGTFSVPPPFAESMYRPDIRAVGETPADITVENRAAAPQAQDEQAAGKAEQPTGKAEPTAEKVEQAVENTEPTAGKAEPTIDRQADGGRDGQNPDA